MPTTTTPPAASMAGAILRRVAETPALANALTGGIFDGIGRFSPPDAFRTMPFLQLHSIAQPRHYDTGGLTWRDYRFQADIYGPDHDAVTTIADAFEAAFCPSMSPLPCVGQLSMVAYVTGGIDGLDDSFLSKNVQLYRASLDLVVQANRVAAG